MPNWKTASKDDRKRLAAISIVLKNYPSVIDELFSATEPCLRTSPPALLRGRSNAECVMIRSAFDLWNSSGASQVIDLIELDSDNMENLFSALRMLRAG